MSSTRLVIQAPIGTVTRIGWKGWPYGPATTLIGSLAGSSLWTPWRAIREKGGAMIPRPDTSTPPRRSGSVRRTTNLDVTPTDNTAARNVAKIEGTGRDL